MIVRYLEDLYCGYTVQVYTAIVQPGNLYMVRLEDEPARFIQIYRKLPLATGSQLVTPFRRCFRYQVQ